MKHLSKMKSNICIVLITSFFLLAVYLELSHGPFILTPMNQQQTPGLVSETHFEFNEGDDSRESDLRLSFGQTEIRVNAGQNVDEIREKSALEIPHQRQRKRENTSLSDEDIGLDTGIERYGKPVYGSVMNQVFIFNAVPKCGSGTFTKTFIELLYIHRIPMCLYRMFPSGKLTNGKHVDIGNGTLPKTYEKTNNNALLTTLIPEPYKHLHEIIRMEKPPLYVHGHFFLPDVPDDMKPAPIFINMIREPLARFQSSFNFRQNGDLLRNKNRKISMSFETCIRRGLRTCIGKHLYAHQRLCGPRQDKRCFTKTNSPWALQRAKENVDRVYTFIGITEEFETSLRIFERLLPDAFGGLVDHYNSANGVNFTSLTATKSEESSEDAKAELPPDVLEMAREQLKEEYELYNYINDKFQRMKQRFGLQ